MKIAFALLIPDKKGNNEKDPVDQENKPIRKDCFPNRPSCQNFS